MGLRDAIDDGLAEIHQTAQKLIASLKIREKIKNAVVKLENSVFINLPQGGNLYVIHGEMIKQIESEGFTVKYDKPCCANPIFYQNNRKISRHKDCEERTYWIGCRSCKEKISTADSKEGLSTFSFYGSIKIEWDINDRASKYVCSCGYYETDSKSSYFQHKESCKG